MKHYVVILDWATNYEENVEVLGVFHTPEEAEEIFKKQLSYERELAKEKDYMICEDFNGCFVAYEEGDYATEHARLFIQEVNK